MDNRVTGIDHLRRLVRGGQHRFYIRLNHGLRSSKYVTESADGEIWVENDVDGSECRLSDTNLYEAIKKGALYYEQD